MMRRIGLRFAAAAIILVHTGCADPDGTKPATSEEPGARPGAVGAGGAGADVKSDGDFVRDIAIKHLAQIEIGRVALQKSTNPDIKSFAQRMIDDHTTAADALKTAVAGQAMDWPAQLDDEHGEIVDELTKKQGEEFDRELLKALIEGHQNLTAKLESRLDVQSLADWKTAAAARTQSRALPDPTFAMRDVEVRPDTSGNPITMQINRWAAGNYPVEQKHLDAARRLENPTQKPSTN